MQIYTAVAIHISRMSTNRFSPNNRLQRYSEKGETKEKTLPFSDHDRKFLALQEFPVRATGH